MWRIYLAIFSLKSIKSWGELLGHVILPFKNPSKWKLIRKWRSEQLLNCRTKNFEKLEFLPVMATVVIGNLPPIFLPSRLRNNVNRCLLIVSSPSQLTPGKFKLAAKIRASSTAFVETELVIFWSFHSFNRRVILYVNFL